MANGKCWACDEYGHVEKDCPTKLYASEIGDDKPIHCGQCDRETRLVYFVRDGIETARRCTSCHPQGHMLPATYKKCRSCQHAIYIWDVRSECGKHQEVGKHIKAKEKEESK